MNQQIKKFLDNNLYMTLVTVCENGGYTDANGFWIDTREEMQ